MRPTTHDHSFNTDLLLDEENGRKSARHDYEAIWDHILDHQELWDWFNDCNNEADFAKRYAQTSGILAMALIWFALVLASLEPLSGPSTGNGPEPAVGAVFIATACIVAIFSAYSIAHHFTCHKRRTDAGKPAIQLLLILIISFIVIVVSRLAIPAIRGALVLMDKTAKGSAEPLVHLAVIAFVVPPISRIGRRIIRNLSRYRASSTGHKILWVVIASIVIVALMCTLLKNGSKMFSEHDDTVGVRGGALVFLAALGCVSAIITGTHGVICNLFTRRASLGSALKRWVQLLMIVAMSLLILFCVARTITEACSLSLSRGPVFAESEALVAGTIVTVLLMGTREAEWLRRFGLLAILLIYAAGLTLIASEPTWVTQVASGFGIVGALTGSTGVLMGPRKRTWLYNRLRTERIRQFRFQLFLLRTEEILAGRPNYDFKTARDRGFREFKDRYGDEKIKTEFQNTRDDDSGQLWQLPEIARQGGDETAQMWLHQTGEPIGSRKNRELQHLLDAYGELRIQLQIDHARYKSKENYMHFLVSPAAQARVLWPISLVCMFSILMLHAIVLFFPDMAGEILASIVIWIAVTALAVRGIEQGLQPEREKERYSRYKADLNDILSRFDSKKSRDGSWSASRARAALPIMKEMERLSYREMRDFLICNNEAMFVM
jgi:hypothetical protein